MRLEAKENGGGEEKGSRKTESRRETDRREPGQTPGSDPHGPTLGLRWFSPPPPGADARVSGTPGPEDDQAVVLIARRMQITRPKSATPSMSAAAMIIEVRMSPVDSG